MILQVVAQWIFSKRQNTKIGKLGSFEAFELKLKWCLTKVPHLIKSNVQRCTPTTYTYGYNLYK